MKNFTDRLKSLKGDESCTSFAKRCGIQQPVMDRYLKGRLPTAENLRQICISIGVSADWLLGLSGDVAGGGVVASGGSAVVSASPNATATAGAAQGEVDRLLGIIEKQQELLRALAAK